MKRTICALMLLSLVLGACQKDKEVRQEVTTAPVKPIIAMNRVIQYPGGTEEKQTVYGENAKFLTTAYFDRENKNKITIGFKVEAEKNAYGDFIYFSMDTTKLAKGLIGTHSLSVWDYPAPVWSTTYGLMYQHSNGSEELLHAVSELGYEVEGSISIQSYDPASHLISGSYAAQIKRLGFHPYQSYTALNKESTVAISGTFKNIKVVVY